MEIIAAILPVATLALIVFLVVRARVAAGSLGRSSRRWSFPRPKPRKPATLISFDSAKMDDELSKLLRKKR